MPEIVAPPEIFNNDDEARKLWERALELLALPQDGVRRLLLDIGCGSGLSGERLTESGHHWVGLDISESMLEVALEREAQGDLMHADMGQVYWVLDGAISISAVQWLCNADNPRKRLKASFESLYRSLARGARAVFQAYPETDAHRVLIHSSAIRAGFSGGVVVDYPRRVCALHEFISYRKKGHMRFFDEEIPACPMETPVGFVETKDAQLSGEAQSLKPMMVEEIENGEFVMTSSEHDKSAKQIDGCFVKYGVARCSTIRPILSSLKSAMWRTRSEMHGNSGKFVNAKLLVAGDTVIFVRKNKSMMEEMKKAGKGLAFEVVYYPRVGLPDFVVKVEESSRIRWSGRMRSHRETLNLMTSDQDVKSSLPTIASGVLQWYLIRHDVVDLYYPERVLRQIGYIQTVPHYPADIPRHDSRAKAFLNSLAAYFDRWRDHVLRLLRRFTKTRLITSRMNMRELRRDVVYVRNEDRVGNPITLV
ncbi:hypothetical protein CASFOL_021140 [Castilleja foliolosa]|uniref:Methyltransferase domain-containing protein n=1 Tax=Castilleja foliolosa TaxID=1961234 RepID=A0ABD3CVP8_9LAMI